MKYTLYILVIVILVSCGSIKVVHDYDKETDFSNYATYNYFSDLETGLSSLDEKRLLQAIDIALQQKGLKCDEEPDFLINVKSIQYRSAPQNTVGVGVGGTGRNVGGGVSIGVPVGGAKISREITLDFVDVNKDNLFWQAKTTSAYKENISPETKEMVFANIVNKALEKYPPKD